MQSKPICNDAAVHPAHSAPASCAHQPSSPMPGSWLSTGTTCSGWKGGEFSVKTSTQWRARMCARRSARRRRRHHDPALHRLRHLPRFGRRVRAARRDRPRPHLALRAAAGARPRPRGRCPRDRAVMAAPNGPEGKSAVGHHASRPRAGRATPGPTSASSRAARCSASCLSNIALAAALRLALNSARLSPHH